MRVKDVFVYLLAVKLVWLCYKKWKSGKLVLQLQSGARTPVVLIPGLGGSRLYDEYGSLKWCNWQGFFPHMTNNWRDALTVKYNPENKKFEEVCYHTPYRKPHWQGSTFVPTPDFGGCEGVGNVLSRNVKSSWQFQSILDTASALGYTEGVNLLGAPYDFRTITSPSVWTEYCRSLKALLEHCHERVVLLSHSMGSTLLLTFFVLYLPQVLPAAQVTAWKKKYVKRWVTVNGAFGGAGKTVRSFLSGDNNGMGYICDTGCHDWYQPLLENASGVLWMLPNPQVFGSEVPIVTVGETGYSASQLPELLEKVSPLASQAYKDTVLPLLTVDPPGVPVVSVTSTQPGTQLQCFYPEKSFHFSEVSMLDERVYYAQHSPNVQHMCGDGTVPYKSLMVPQKWLELPSPQSVTFLRLRQENVAHTSVLVEPETVKMIMTLLE
jgi:lysophospholipase-3